MGCLRSLTGATAGAERSAPTTTSLSPASSCKASHSPSAKVRTPPRSLSSSGAAGATQPRAAVLPCWRDGCGASCDANCDASCDASESGAVAKRRTHAERMAKGRAKRGMVAADGHRRRTASAVFRDLRAQPGAEEVLRQPVCRLAGRRMLRATLLLSALCCAAGFMAPASPLRIAAVSQSSQLDISSEPLPALRCHAEPASQTVGRRLAAWSEQSSR